jgi:hypothetical protein
MVDHRRIVIHPFTLPAIIPQMRRSDKPDFRNKRYLVGVSPVA